jgi:UPF0755 protein
MKRLLSCLTVIVFLLIGSWIFFQLQFEKANDNPFGDKKFTVELGTGVDSIAENLKTQGFVGSPVYFKLYSWLSDKSSDFQPGEYTLNTTMSVKELVQVLTVKPLVREEMTITLVEGWTSTDMAQYFEEKGLFTEQEFLDYIAKPDVEAFPWLSIIPKGGSLEGFLYPDTYRVYSDATPADVVGKMLRNFDAKLTPEFRETLIAQKKTIFDTVTLASIVEKEMFGFENRQIVAGIFLQRLADHYPLQSDATVNYVTKSGTTRPTLEETQLENAYNTYRNAGLPPGPICNPSIEAIRSVIEAKKTNYYFFLTTPDNQIIYSRNHEEHIANRNKYLK